MKRITLIMLVAMIPFLTIAQKRSKKNKVENTEKSYEFMVIIGYEMSSGNVTDAADMQDVSTSKVKIMFDFGGLRTPEVEKLSSQQYRSMAHAVNIAAKSGWEFVNANFVNLEEINRHYYYMKRKK
jgi:hypothetical protein